MVVDLRSSPWGAEPIALFLGGVLALALTAPFLVLHKSRAGTVRGPPAFLMGFVGFLFGAFAYAGGLALMGRGAMLVEGSTAALSGSYPSWLLVGVPWAWAFAALVGFVVAFVATRSSWHPAGAFVLLALALALGGWVGFLLIERLPWAVVQTPVIQVGWVGFILVQMVAVLLLFAYALYTLDALVRSRWKRAAANISHDSDLRPKVALHVPSYNEDPKIVEQTLSSLCAQDYPRDRFMVILVDDSTDTGSVQELRHACNRLGVMFVHREDRRGFKAGALNEALRRTPEDFDVVGIVDADFVVEPEFLRETVGYFTDPRVSFVQTPQEIANLDDSWVARYAGIGQRFFYQTAMHTRNESEASMFCGSMGMVRRDALERVGGWVDGHISEDADLSFRLEDAGYSSVYVAHKAYGRGLVPDGGESYRVQQARWANGGARLLRDHHRRMLLGPMTWKQKSHHVTSSLFWFDGTIALIFAFTTSVLALTFLSGRLGQAFFIPEFAFIAILPVVIIADSTIRLAVVAKRRLQAAARDVFGLLIVWWSVKLVTATEAWAGLLGSTKPFNTTPKVSTRALPRRRAMVKAFRATPIESTISAWLALLSMGVVVRLAIVGGTATQVILFCAVAFVLAFYSLYFSAAWISVYMGHTTRTTKKVPVSGVRVEQAPRIPG